jgi:hypothetical protein
MLAAGQAEEGLLDEVLGRRPVVDEPARELDQAPRLRPEQRDHQRVGVPPDAAGRQVRSRIHSPHHLYGRASRRSG